MAEKRFWTTDEYASTAKFATMIEYQSFIDSNGIYQLPLESW